MITGKIEQHFIQSFPASVLNRGREGNPKDTIFGNVRRDRISSQCYNFWLRKNIEELISRKAFRTRIAKLIVETGKENAVNILDNMGLKADFINGLKIKDEAGTAALGCRR